DASDPKTLKTSNCGVSEDVVANEGDEVRCWMDKSGRTNHMEAGENQAATWLPDAKNGFGALNFGGNHFYTGILPGLTGAQAHTIFIVNALESGSTADQYLLRIGNGGENGSLHISRIAGSIIKHGFWHNDHTYTSTDDGTYKIQAFDYDGGSGDTSSRHAWEQGQPVTPGEDDATGNPLALSENPPAWVGARDMNRDHSSGQIAEILVFDRVLSDEERIGISLLLALKWGSF
ncbi:MAG: hypothetical protein CMP10_03095, partial [Zetaproteobacteria bacterium]|nr:hypothetical protein [Pseudobdellovibrionaceae bacterium]